MIVECDGWTVWKRNVSSEIVLDQKEKLEDTEEGSMKVKTLMPFQRVNEEAVWLMGCMKDQEVSERY